MKTLYGKLKVPKLLKLPALIVLLLALSYTAWSQSANSPVCVPNDINLSASGGALTTVGAVSYSWIGNSPNVAGWSSTVENPVITSGTSPGYPAGPYPVVAQYALTIYYSSGPPQTGFINVSCVNPPSPTIMGGTATVCAGNTTTNTYTTETGMTSYAWSVTGGSIMGATNSSTVDINWGTATPGTHTITLTVYANTCSSTVTMNVLVRALPTPSISGPTLVCQNVPGYQYGTQPGMTGYSWTAPCATISGASNTQTITVSFPTAGTCTLSVIYTDANGCTATQSGTYLPWVNPTPATAVVSGTATICTYGNYDYTAAASGVTSFTWNVQGGSIVAGTTGASITVNWATSGTKTVTATSLSSGGCSGATTTYTVNVAPVGTPVITGDALACMPTGASTTVNYSVTATGATSFSWTVDGGATFLGGVNTGANVTVVYSAVQTYTVGVTATNTYCSNTASMTTYVGPTPVPTVTGLFTVCNSTCASYYTETGMSDYNWVVTSNSTATITAGQGTRSITVCWGATGTGTVQVYATLGSCQAPSGVYNVVISPSITDLQILTVTPPALTQVCENSTGWNYYATAQGTPLTQWQWAVTGPNTAPGISTITAGQSTYSITVEWGSLPGQDPGTVNVVVGRGGCTAMTEVHPDIVAPANVVTPTMSGAAKVCQGETRSFTAPAGYYNYTWVVTNGVPAGTTVTTSNTLNVTFPDVYTVASVSVNYTSINHPSACFGVAKTKTLTVYALPTPTVISGTTSVCVNTSGVKYGTQTGMTGYSWTILPAGSATVSGGTTSTITVTWLTAGLKTITVNYTNANGCTATVTTPYNVTVNPLPVPTITANPTIVNAKVCVGMTNTFSTQDGMTNYLWTIVNGVGSVTTSNVNNEITVTYDTPGIWTISVVYTNANGCTANPGATTVITVLDVPAPEINGNPSACLNTLGVIYSAQPGYTSYTWSVTGGTAAIASGQGTESITVNWTNTGSTGYTGVVNLTVSNGTCSGSDSYNVAVGTLPVPVVTGHTEVCENTGGHIYQVSVPNAVNWSWNVIGPPGTQISSGQGTASITVFWAQANVVTATSVWVTVTNNVGCSGTSPVLPVAIKAAPAVYSVTGDAHACTATNHTYSLYGTPTGLYNYKWVVTGSTGTIVGSSTGSSVVVKWNGPAAVTGTVGVSYSNINPANGDAESCRTTAIPITVNVTARPVPTIAGQTPVCEGSSWTYTTQNGMSGYDWTIPGATSIVYGHPWGESYSATVTVTWGASGSRVMSVMYTDALGCEATRTTSYTVAVQVQPETPSITDPLDPQYICSGSARQYYTPFVNAAFNYTWSATGGTIQGTPGAKQRTITVVWGAAGTGEVNLAVTNGTANCTASSVKTVTINPLPTPTVTGPDIVCKGTHANYYTEPGMIEYTWVVTGGGNTTITVGQFTKSITVYWDTPSPGTVKVFVKNQWGCQASSAVKTVTIDPSVPTITGPDEVCGYPNTWVTYTTEAGMTNYVWTVNSNVYTWTGQGTNQIQVMFYPNTGETPFWGEISVIYTGSCTAAQPTYLEVMINPIPQPTIVGDDWIVCQNSCSGVPSGIPPYEGWSGYFVEDYNPNSTYEWSVSGGTMVYGPNTGTIYVCWNTCPSGTLQVTETNEYGCIATSQTYTVTINPKPAPHIFGPLTVNTNQTATYYTPVHSGNLYSWSVVGGTIIGGQGTNQITVEWGPIPPCWCGTVQVCESTIGGEGYTLCTECDMVSIDLLPSDYTISGYLSYKNDYNTKLNGVEVLLKDAVTGSIIATTETGPNMLSAGEPGFFAFVNVPEGTYYVIPYGNGDNSWGGNNATDALIVQLNTLSCGLDPLNCIVADVNGSGAINATDALNIKLRVVGMVGYYAAGDWSYEFEPVTIDEYETPVYLPDMKGLCVGDVNGSYIPQGMKAASLLSSVDNGLQTVPVNAPFTYELRSNSEAGIGAMTLFMGYDESKFEVEKVNTVLEGMKYSIANGQIALAWSDTKTLNVENNDVIISLQMRAKVALTEATNVFDLQAGSEFADAIAQPFSNFELKMGKLITTGAGEFSLGNYPNPFRNSTDIVYTLPETGTVKLIVTDMLGKTVTTLVNGVVQDAGTYKVTINGNDGKMKPGVYLYRIEVEGENASFVKTNKMTLTR